MKTRKSMALAQGINSVLILLTLALGSGAVSINTAWCQVTTKEWVARYNAPYGGIDNAEDTAVDAAGNVYVTGTTRGSDSRFTDYITVKYDAGGNQLWVARYNGPSNSNDRPSALAVDAAGNVYVTGQSEGSGTGYDYATIKYDAVGNQLWVARYNGPGNGDDNHDNLHPALAVDAAGNVYVTGSSLGSGTASDYATVKYDAGGNQLWVARYNGPGNGGDRASALAVDAAGNVYVTGASQGSDTGEEYATVKYDAGGNQLWVARYNGPGNATDRPSALAVDAAGNVYVTGESWGLDNRSIDYATVKYDTNGNELWVARLYFGPDVGSIVVAIAVDAVGNVYVTGSDYGNNSPSDYATVKYDAGGNQLWVARYNGPGNSDDRPSALAVDAAGNVYVTGSSLGSGTGDDYATIKYDADGNELWVARYNGPCNATDRPSALALDAAGNVYVTGSSLGSGTGDDYATVKYDADSNQLWVARYNGLGTGGDHASALAVDAAGNVYVTGTSQGSNTSDDFSTVKYDADGNQLWVARYNGPDNGYDNPSALAVDKTGNVYVTGSSPGGYATVKYDAGGNQLWVARYGLGNSLDRPISLAVDAAGNVYVTGTSQGSSTFLDYATVKYDAGGNQLWVARYNGPGNGDDRAAALAVDAAGNVYVTGGSQEPGTGYDYATVKYDAGGNELWVRRYNEQGNGTNAPRSLAVDAAGNVYVTGQSEGSGSYDYATIKYDAGGNELWVARYGTYTHGPTKIWDDFPSSLAVDAAGNVYVTGSSSFRSSMGFDNSPSDYVTVRYDAGGNQLWVARYNGPGNGDDRAAALAVDAAGNVYVTGQSEGSDTGYDYATIMYDAGGNELYVHRYNGPGNGDDLAVSLVLDTVGNIYVAGSSVGSDTSWDYATVKLTTGDSGGGGGDGGVVNHSGSSGSGCFISTASP